MRIERLEDTKNKLRQLMQRWDNRLLFKHLPFIKQYLDGRLSIVLNLECTLAPNERDPICRAGHGRKRHRLAAVVEHPDARRAQQGKDRDEKLVFVDVVEFVKGPEGVIPSLVWLYAIEDGISDVGGDALYLTLSNGICQVISGFVKREMDVGGISATSADQFGSHEVERSPQIVDRISNDERNLGRHRMLALIAEDMVANLTIEVRRDFVGVWARDGSQTSLQILDVALGPIDL